MAAEPPDLGTLQDAVWANLDAVRDLQVVIDQRVGDANPKYKKTMHRFEWAFRDDGRMYLVISEEFAPGETPGPVASRNAYNGEELRTIIYDSESPYLPRSGKIHPREYAYGELTAPACYLAEFGRAWGFGIDNKSIGEWLQTRGARTAGRETIDGYECAVVEVSAPMRRDPSLERYYRFYLADAMAFALVGWDAIIEGELTLKVRSDTFDEVLPGIWFPLSGRTQGFLNKPSAINNFEVVSLKCNQGIPDDAFVIEFEPGFPVTDHRKAVPLLWSEGINRSHDLFRMWAPDLYIEPEDGDLP